MKVFITSQALSNGIYEKEAEYVRNEDALQVGDQGFDLTKVIVGLGTAKTRQYVKPDWHTNFEDAVARAEEMRDAAIEDLTARFDRLSAIDFKVFRGGLKVGKVIADPIIDQPADKSLFTEHSGDTTEVEDEGGGSVATSENPTSPPISNEPSMEVETVGPSLGGVAVVGVTPPVGYMEIGGVKFDVVDGILEQPVVEIPIEIKPQPVGVVMSKDDYLNTTLANSEAPTFTAEGKRSEPPPPAVVASQLTPAQIGLRQRPQKVAPTLVVQEPAQPVVSASVRQRLVVPPTSTRKRL